MVQPLDRRLMTEATFQSKVAEQDTVINLYGDRVRAVEALGGLAPGDLSDATLASILAQPDAQSQGPLAAAVGTQVGTPGTTVRNALDATFVSQSRVSRNGIIEWWTNPVATLLRTPYERVVSGELGDPVDDQSAVLFVERSLALGVTKRYEVASVVADDHCVPALHAEEGRRFLMAYQNHNGDQLLRFKVSDRSGHGRSFATAPEVTRSMGASVSYADIRKVHHLSTATQDTFYVIYRHGTFAWGYLTVMVNQRTGQISFGAQRNLVTSGSEQCYFSVADAYTDDDQVLRLGFGYNPTANRHSIRMIYWNLATGQITNQAGAVIGSTSNGNSLPITDTTISPLVDEPASDWNRRFIYTRPGPDNVAVLYIDYRTTDVAGTSRYKLAELVPGDTLPGDEFDGLLPGDDGYASAPGANTNLTAGFDYTWVGRMPAGPQQASIAHRYDGTSTGIWWLRVDQDGNIGAWVRTTSGATSIAYGGGRPLTNSWGDVVGIRLRVDVSGNVARRYYSLNPEATTPTWTEYGSGTSLQGATALASSTSLPLVVSSTSSNLMGVQAVKSTRLDTLAGSAVASTDFTTDWVATLDTSTDLQGVTWTLHGSARIGNTDPVSVSPSVVTHDLGPAGDYFGYTYLRGGAFEVPSASGAVVLSRNANGIETLSRLTPTAEGWEAETIRQSSSADYKIVRPYVPVNAGSGMVMISRVTDYSPTGFLEWASDTEVMPM